MMDVPVIAAAWFKGDVADDYALERQYVQIASSNKILGKVGVFLSACEDYRIRQTMFHLADLTV